jgi:DNA-binding transcriptional regulator YiaG
MATRIDVKAIRSRLGENREDFGRRVSASSRTVRRWENGEVEPSPMALKHLDALLADAPEPSPRRRTVELSG